MDATNRNATVPKTPGQPGGDGAPASDDAVLELLAQHLPIPLVCMLADGTLTYANDEAALLTGYPVDEMLGRPFWLDITHVEDRHLLKRALRSAVLRGHADATLRYQPLDGETRRAEFRLQRIAERSEVSATIDGRTATSPAASPQRASAS